MRKLLGAPINVKIGYIRRIQINVPWNELWSKPCEITMDDIHIVVDSPNHFDFNFMKKFHHKEKKYIFDDMLKQFKEKQEGKAADENEQETYMERIKKIIKENLRFVVNNLHMRFEDSNICRKDKCFNLGIVYDQCIYSSTNSRFDRVFINIDDKRQEKRSFAWLEFKQFATYWNTNAHDNWSNNSEFLKLDCPKMIDYSMKYVENLKRKYN